MNMRRKINTQTHSVVATPNEKQRDRRYQQLMDLANEGNQHAADDLYREYGVVNSQEGTSNDAN